MKSSNPYAAPQTESLEHLHKHSVDKKKKSTFFDWMIAGIFTFACLAVPIGMAVEASSYNALDDPYRGLFQRQLPEDSNATNGPEGFNTNYKIDW